MKGGTSMEIALTLFFVAFGLLIGSFLNVVAIRLLKKESISFPPSHCVKCNHQLHSKDLIPVLSYMWLRGKCRYCRVPISIRYPAGELVTGLLYALAYLVIGYEKELLAALFLTSILIVITQTDLVEMLIPNKIVLVGIVGALFIRLWVHPLPLYDYLIASVAGSGALLTVGLIFSWLMKKEALGGGDVKLYVFIGLILGIKLTLLSIFIASVIGTNKQLVHREIPFGPYIAVGSLIVYYAGNSLLDWYLGLLHL
jgi:leader peptidase (prepilin peptidase)/N-methyltransferase